jgi:regulator of replication initiation timing
MSKYKTKDELIDELVKENNGLRRENARLRNKLTTIFDRFRVGKSLITAEK